MWTWYLHDCFCMGLVYNASCAGFYKSYAYKAMFVRWMGQCQSTWMLHST